MGRKRTDKKTTTAPTSWRDVLPIHPAAEFFPLMPPDELRALGEDIKANGLKNPVAVWQADSGSPRLLLDGRSRLDAMTMVGIDVIAMERMGALSHEMVEGDPYVYVVSANIHRRHLTAEQKRDLIAKLLKAAPGKSNRQIAKTVKASPTTVGTVRAEMETTGDVSKLDTRQDLVENLPDLAVLVEPLLIVRRVLREQIIILHRRLLAIVREDEVCRRLMTTPGVGPVVALTYRATVDVPARFRKSKAVGAVFGLTCSKYQSGEIDRNGRISRCGDEMMRVMLYEAAQSMLHSKKWSWLKAWAMQIARRRGMKKAIVALARRLAVIMHRIWVDGTEFRWTREQAAAAA